MYRQSKLLAQLLGEALHLFRLYAFDSAHAQRISHDDFRHAVFGDHILQLAEIGLLVAPAQSLNPCAVIPSGSETAKPMVLLPTSKPRIRGEWLGCEADA